MIARALALLFCLLLASGCFAANVLILIRSERVGHAISPDLYAHPTWVLWPKAWDSSGVSPFMSLTSGVDWQASAADLAFNKGQDGRMVSARYARLSRCTP
jgi:hypothetical protein